MHSTSVCPSVWEWRHSFSIVCINNADRLSGLVVRVPGYRSRGSRFDSRRYQIFWEEVSLERGPLSLVSTIEKLLGRCNGSGVERREYGRGDPLRWFMRIGRMLELPYGRVHWRVLILAMWNLQPLLLPWTVVRYISSLHVIYCWMQVIRWEDMATDFRPRNYKYIARKFRPTIKEKEMVGCWLARACIGKRGWDCYSRHKLMPIFYSCLY
jgi:hypothetical protein